MKPIPHPNANLTLGSPSGWDENEHGPCASLEVLRVGEIYQQCWKPSWRCRLRLLVGRPVRLTTIGTPPPIAMEVT